MKTHLAVLLILASSSASASPPPQLSAMAQAELNKRVQRHITKKVTQTPETKKFAARGLSPEADPIERGRVLNGRLVAPFNVGFAVIETDESVRPVDAALDASIRIELRRVLRREPTLAEVDGQLAVFDARIAAANASLAQDREALATLYRKEGRLTPVLLTEIHRLARPKGSIEPKATKPTLAEWRALQSDALIRLFNALSL